MVYAKWNKEVRDKLWCTNSQVPYSFCSVLLCRRRDSESGPSGLKGHLPPECVSPRSWSVSCVACGYQSGVSMAAVKCVSKHTSMLVLLLVSGFFVTTLRTSATTTMETCVYLGGTNTEISWENSIASHLLAVLCETEKRFSSFLPNLDHQHVSDFLIYRWLSNFSQWRRCLWGKYHWCGCCLVRFWDGCLELMGIKTALWNGPKLTCWFKNLGNKKIGILEKAHFKRCQHLTMYC